MSDRDQTACSPIPEYAFYTLFYFATPHSVTSNDARATVPTDIRHIFKPTFSCTEWDSVVNYLSYFCSLFYDTFSSEIANQVVNHAVNGLI